MTARNVANTFTSNEETVMMLVNKTQQGFSAQIVLSNGAIIGTGFGGTQENAIHFACKDAFDDGHRDAAVGHARIYGDASDKEWAEAVSRCPHRSSP